MVTLCLAAGHAVAQTPQVPVVEPAALLLLEKHTALAAQLGQNNYRRPLFLESSDDSKSVNGHAYAVLDFPFSMVSATFSSPGLWCEVLILHLNTKYCRAQAETSPTTIKMNIGKKTEQKLEDAFALVFAYRLVTASPTHLAAQLNANEGPLGTNNYRIELQAVPLTAGRTFVHLRYSYGYGVSSRLAMQAYLATVGNGKIGFTPAMQGQKSSFVGGIRGAVERNTMRYYLAIEAYLVSLAQPAAQQLNSRLQYWFDATEQYAEQLHEIEKSTYLNMKKGEHQRQQRDL